MAKPPIYISQGKGAALARFVEAAVRQGVMYAQNFPRAEAKKGDGEVQRYECNTVVMVVFIPYLFALSDLPLHGISPILLLPLPGSLGWFLFGRPCTGGLAHPLIPRALQRTLRFSIGEGREVEVVRGIFDKPITDTPSAWKKIDEKGRCTSLL
jgi:hypothetical protein